MVVFRLAMFAWSSQPLSAKKSMIDNVSVSSLAGASATAGGFATLVFVMLGIGISDTLLSRET